MAIEKAFEGYGKYWVVMNVRVDGEARYMWIDTAIFVDKAAYDEQCTPTKTMTFELSGENFPTENEFASGDIYDVAYKKLQALPAFEGGVTAE